MTLVQSEPKKIYIWVDVQPITTAWIYHNSELWLISLSSDWANWLTIADKNLWATQVWNEWDTLSEANCGKFYQWWNNYWFPFDWTFNKSSTKPNASWYVSNYSNSTFITTASSDTTKDWSSTTNNNLWWWEWTTTQRKWPCATWFHIPTNTELNVFRTLASMIWWNISNYIKMPVHRYITYSWAYMDTYQEYYFWTSSTDANPSLSWVYNVYVFTWTAWTSSIFKTGWHLIRPFKNEAVQPDTSRTKLY